MKTYEIEQKLYEAAKKKKKHFADLFLRFGDQCYFELAKEEAEKMKKIQARLKQSEEAKARPKKERKKRQSLDRAIKESLIDMTAYEVGIEKVLICAGTSPTTATAIIDDIIKSAFDAETKLTMIKLFIDNHFSSLDIDGLLNDEMIIMPRKRVK